MVFIGVIQLKNEGIGGPFLSQWFYDSICFYWPSFVPLPSSTTCVLVRRHLGRNAIAVYELCLTAIHQPWLQWAPLFCHCNMQQFPLPAAHPNMVQLHLIQKEFCCTRKKTKHAKTQKNKSQRATDPDTKVSGSANRIWKKPCGDYWLIPHKHQLVASGSPHDFKGDKLSNYCKLNKLQLNMLLK